MEIMEIIETSETLRPRRPHINHVYHAEVVEFQQVPSFWLLFIDSLALVAWLIGRSGGGELWRPLRSVNDKGDSWRHRISITNRPKRCFLGKVVISTGKGDRSVVGHFWGFS